MSEQDAKPAQMARTCADCEHSKEPPCAKCKHCFVNGGGVYGSKFKRACPLPRVGSKEWGWRKSYVVWGKKSLTKWSLQQSYCCIEKHHGYLNVWVRCKLVASCIGTLRDAKRIAELLARLDWKREHGGKNGV